MHLQLYMNAKQMQEENREYRLLKQRILKFVMVRKQIPDNLIKNHISDEGVARLLLTYNAEMW